MVEPTATERVTKRSSAASRKKKSPVETTSKQSSLNQTENQRAATPPSYSVPPVERALQLLRYIGNGHRCQNLSVTARELGINRTTLIRLIHTLAANRMIELIDGNAGYRLGTGLISLAAQAIHGRDIVQVCQPLLVELTQVTGMSSHLGILDGTDAVYLSRETPNTHLVSNIRAGSRMPAYASAIGRAMLAALPQNELLELYEGHKLDAVTNKTPATLQALITQAVTDRKAQVAWSKGNFEHSIGACAAVVLDHHARPAGAINVSGPVQLYTDHSDPAMQKIKNAVMQAAKLASRGLGFAGSRS